MKEKSSGGSRAMRAPFPRCDFFHFHFYRVFSQKNNNRFCGQAQGLASLEDPGLHYYMQSLHNSNNSNILA